MGERERRRDGGLARVGGQGRTGEDETGCSAWMRAKMYFFPLSISSLRANRGRLDYQSGAASGTFFSVERVQGGGRKGARTGGRTNERASELSYMPAALYMPAI